MWRFLELVRTLTMVYNNQRAIIRLLDRGGFNVGMFNLDGTALEVWTGIIRDLELRDSQNLSRIKTLMTIVVEEHPDNPVFQDALSGANIRNGANSGKEPGNKGGARAMDMYLEKIMEGESTLLPIGFLEKGVMKAKAVGRIVTPRGLGSGFLISKTNLFLTNNHVFPDAGIAAASKVQFNYQRTISGLPDQPEDFEVDATLFHTSVVNDWSVVKLKGNPSAKYGFLEFAKKPAKQGDFVNIVQHPGGEHKQIGMYHNMVTFADPSIVQYLTDTLPGSSGSPVHNSDWDVIALHHSGGWIQEPGTPTPVLRNEGIAIQLVADELRTAGVSL